MPPNPCSKCKFEKCECLTAGLICRLAIEAWVNGDADIPGCPFKQEDFYHGIEGVYA